MLRESGFICIKREFELTLEHLRLLSASRDNLRVTE